MVLDVNFGCCRLKKCVLECLGNTVSGQFTMLNMHDVSFILCYKTEDNNKVSHKGKVNNYVHLSFSPTVTLCK